jgi:hypothetical protein
MSDLSPEQETIDTFHLTAGYAPPLLPEVTLGSGFDRPAEEALPGYEEDLSEGLIGSGYDETLAGDTTDPTIVAAASGEMAVLNATGADDMPPPEEPGSSGGDTPPAEDEDMPETDPGDSTIVPPGGPPTDGTQAAPDDDDGRPLRGPMDMPAPDGSADLLSEFFGSAEVSVETREAFETTVQQLMELDDPPSRVDRQDFVVAKIGEEIGPRIEVVCVSEEHRLSRGGYTDRQEVMVRVTTTPVPEDPSDTIKNPPVERIFRDGRTDNYNLSDADFTAAMGTLRAAMPEAVWSWVEETRQVAANVPSGVERQATVEFLVDTAPEILRPCHSLGEAKQFVNPDHTVVSIKTVQANQNFLRTQPDDFVTREVTLRTPENVTYIYRGYRDGTEQLVAESWDQDQVAELRAMGLTAMRPGQAASIGSEARRMGVQRPSEALMSRLNELLRRATNS